MNQVENHPSQAGFSLVEVTLALLVVAVGLTATLGLFPEGLMATREAVNNTETALFADYVFSTLELSAAYNSLRGNVTSTVLEDGTDDFMSGMFSKDAPVRKFQIVKSSTAKTFYWMPDYFGILSGDMQHDYFDGKLTTAVFTYTLDIGLKDGNGSPFVCVLCVWPGEYAENLSKTDLRLEDARIFYREIIPPQ